ncbi:TetR/AcrR family transcriptional regulator [Thermopolyspora sp. NPDC052614]|uniref:TetR/AcrR family transcriptional regulator n=1 Tax=Thermopolyspora sp. NPDC052614 TaxID=3155682 RepID=UPI00343AC12D
MKDDTRSRLVDSGLRLLREGGLDAVTLRAVGTLTGVSRTAPYRHFADKAELLATMSARVLDDLTRHVRASYSDQDSPEERLRTFYESYIRYALAHPQEYRLLFSSALKSAGKYPELAAATDRAIQELVADWPGAEPHADAGASRARLLALVSTAHGLAEYTLSGHYRHKGIDPQDVIDALLDVMRPVPAAR